MTLQTDPGWLPSRRGKLTASRMADALDMLKSGKESAARRKYKIELLAERISDYAVDHYVTPAMQRGLDLEPDAREAYEAASGNIPAPARSVDHPLIEHFSATPDGFVDGDGLLELKVPTVPTFLAWKLAGVVPEEHVPQLLAQLACTRRKWTDFVAYCPEMPAHKRLLIARFEPKPEQIAEIEKAAQTFLAEVEAMFEQFTTKAA